MKTTNRKLILSLIGALIVICAFGVSIYAVNARITLMGDELSDSQYCDIAKLIYDTDGFIFPALFTGCEDPRKTAERVFLNRTTASSTRLLLMELFHQSLKMKKDP